MSAFFVCTGTSSTVYPAVGNSQLAVTCNVGGFVPGCTSCHAFQCLQGDGGLAPPFCALAPVANSVSPRTIAIPVRILSSLSALFLLNFGPGIFQCHRPVEHGLARF